MKTNGMKNSALRCGGGGDKEGVGTRSVDRAMSILAVFRDVDSDLGINDVARRLSLTPSTVHRIMRALTREGYLRQDVQTEQYSLGRSAYLLGQAAGRRLGLPRVLPVLERIVVLSGESVNLGVRDGNEMVVLMHAESREPLRISQRSGSRLPVHASGMGKAMLAYCTSIDDEIDTLTKPLCAITPHTIVSVERLRSELQDTLHRGYSIDDEEALPGVRCIGAPIISSDGRVIAGLAIQGPVVRMSHSRLKELSPLAVSAAKEIGDLLPATLDSSFLSPQGPGEVR